MSDDGNDLLADFDDATRRSFAKLRSDLVLRGIVPPIGELFTVHQCALDLAGALYQLQTGDPPNISEFSWFASAVAAFTTRLGELGLTDPTAADFLTTTGRHCAKYCMTVVGRPIAGHA